MFHLMISLSLCVLSAAMHLLFCRFLGKRSLQKASLAVISITGFFSYILISRTYTEQTITGRISNIHDFPLTFSAGLVFVLFMLTYCLFFATANEDSPTQRILVLLQARGPLSLDALAKEITNEEFVIPRFETLLTSRLVIRTDGRYRLSTWGMLASQILNIYQRVLDCEIGG